MSQGPLRGRINVKFQAATVLIVHDREAPREGARYHGPGQKSGGHRPGSSPGRTHRHRCPDRHHHDLRQTMPNILKGDVPAVTDGGHEAVGARYRRGLGGEHPLEGDRGARARDHLLAPPPPELGQKWQHDLPEHGRQGEVGHEPVKTAWAAGSSKASRARRRAPDSSLAGPGSAAGTAPVRTPLSSASTGCAASAADSPRARWACIRRTRCACDSEYNRNRPPNAPAEAGLTALPRPQDVVADAETPAQLTDAQYRRALVRYHANTLQYLDGHQTIINRTDLVPAHFPVSCPAVRRMMAGQCSP